MDRITIFLKVKMLKNIFILCNLILMIFSSTTVGQIVVGVNSGINLSGAQDHKFKQYNQKNELINYYKTKDIDGIASLVINFHVIDWGVVSSFKNMGIRFDYLSWSLTTMVDEFPANISPPFTHIEQERSAFVVTILGRKPLLNSAFSHLTQNQIYFSGGIGGGLVYSDVQHGIQKWGVGLQLLGNISVPLHQNFFLQIETRYFLAPDVDCVPKPGWQVDTSGTHTFLRFDPHLDTSFLGFLLGVEWRLF